MEAFFAQAPRRYAAVYMDDILIFSATLDLHMSDLHDVLGLLAHLGVKFDKRRSVHMASKRLLG